MVRYTALELTLPRRITTQLEILAPFSSHPPLAIKAPPAWQPGNVFAFNQSFPGQIAISKSHNARNSTRLSPGTPAFTPTNLAERGKPAVTRHSRRLPDIYFTNNSSPRHLQLSSLIDSFKRSSQFQQLRRRCEACQFSLLDLTFPPGKYSPLWFFFTKPPLLRPYTLRLFTLRLCSPCPFTLRLFIFYLFTPRLFVLPLPYFVFALISSHLVSSHLVSSHLVFSHFGSFQFVSSQFVSSYFVASLTHRFSPFAFRPIHASSLSRHLFIKSLYSSLFTPVTKASQAQFH
ncbi:hypothetical protein CFIO01_06292 [Colletotrichum fioriniae PJ7]|uniref:Uncharacterized protein n=1 Tax=Colletotrichum fioriniae PJ7 TaxID=1445577 RepID=A0A010R5S1_9PEZI|nr:hypothetical protein CFIO01_06292 [Colletotrichum fioriniae PJ7]